MILCNSGRDKRRKYGSRPKHWQRRRSRAFHGPSSLSGESESRAEQEGGYQNIRYRLGGDSDERRGFYTERVYKQCGYKLEI